MGNWFCKSNNNTTFTNKVFTFEKNPQNEMIIPDGVHIGSKVVIGKQSVIKPPPQVLSCENPTFDVSMKNMWLESFTSHASIDPKYCGNKNSSVKQ